MRSGTIFNIQPFSIYDGPGIRTTVFFKGCNLRCAWCHNPESWLLKPQLEFLEEKCIGCGDAAEGGVDIINLNVDGIALATIADSFAAIEQRVVNEKRLSWEEMYAAVKNNYEGTENIRLMLKNIPRFGSPESLGRKWAKKISTTYTELVDATPTPKHHLRVVPGLFSHGDIYMHGRDLPATPNGRKAGEPISHSSEPDPGFASGLTSFSPTLKSNAVAMVQPGLGNSATLINMNCITKDRIRRAHADPDSEPDLVVRVTGYSAFFASLSKDYRQQIVDRYLTDGR